MRGTYFLWLLALGLKFAGASWDVSWHFRTVRESISPPHLLNGAGELLFLGLLLNEWRRRTPERLLPLRIMIGGMLLWLAAVPFDELWHRIHGLDLTTWSPSHILLFYGTGIAVTGLALLFLVDLGWRPGRAPDLRRAPFVEKATLALLVLFAAEAFLFPLTYNEHTTVAVETVALTPDALDPEIVEMAVASPDPWFHGTPRWLYPVYCIGAAALVMVVARRALGPGWGFAILGGYAALRLGVDIILGEAGWPQSVVPWQYLAIAIAWEVAWRLPARAQAQAATGAALSTAAAYAYWLAAPRFTLAIPIGAASWAGGLFAAFVGAALGWLAWEAAMAPPRAEPLTMAARRRWAGVEAQARDLVARLR